MNRFYPFFSDPSSSSVFIKQLIVLNHTYLNHRARERNLNRLLVLI